MNNGDNKDYFNNENNSYQNESFSNSSHETENYIQCPSQPPIEPEVQHTQPQKKKGGKAFIKAIALILVAIIAGGASGAGSYFIIDKIYNGGTRIEAPKDNEYTDSATENNDPVDIPKTDVSIENNTSGDAIVTNVTQVVEAVMPAMVSINVISTTTVTGMWGQTQEYEVQGSGSGIIILQSETMLFITTNHHVIDNAKKISVTFADGKNYEATVKGSDSDYDLAVLAIELSKIENNTLSKIKCASLGSSDKLNLGEPAIAIGNALGYGQSVTVGYISATEREVQMEDKTMVLVQTDAAINPGNSGGALINIKGEVIGINSSKYSSTEVEGMGFAIPISNAVPIINEIINETALPEDEQGYLGITGGTVNASWVSSYGWPEGVYISAVTKDSPADIGGIRAHDIITKLDGKTIKTIDSLTEKLKKKTGGDVVEITIMRQNNYGTFEEQVLTITLKSKKDT